MEDEEEDPAEAFELPVGFPSSLMEGGPNFIAFLTQGSISSPVSASLSVVESSCKGRVGGREREIEPKFSGGAVAACASNFSLLPERFIRLPTY